MPRLPTPADFPPSLTLSVTPPPTPNPPTHALLLLHGLGDTHLPFTRFGAAIALPGVVCVSLRGLAPLPGMMFPDTQDTPQGFHWGDDILFDPAAGMQMDVDAGFAKAVGVVVRVVKEGLVGKCGFRADEVLVFGFGQGGMVALAAAREMGAAEGMVLGGAVSVGGPLPASSTVTGEGRCRTPALVLGGSSRSLVTVSAAQRIKSAFGDVQFVQWRKAGDGMPANREEMLPVMQFFARRLRSRALPGTVEIN